MTTLHTMVGAALAAVCIFPLAQNAAPTAKPTVVGVVNVFKAIEQYPKWTRFTAQVDEFKKAGNVRLDELTKEMDELKGTATSLSEGTREREACEYQYGEKAKRREFEFQSLNKQIEVESARAMLECYADVEAAIAKVSARRGVQVVLSNVELEAPKGEMSAREVLRRARLVDSRNLWYAAADVDLTGDVVKELQVMQPADKGDKVDKGHNGGETGTPAKPDAPKSEAPKPESGKTDPKGGG